jgi:hypothetical protein
MKTRFRQPSTWVITATVAVAGVLTAAIFVGVKAGTIVLLALAGLVYALIWEGGVRVSSAFQKRLQRRRDN